MARIAMFLALGSLCLIPFTQVVQADDSTPDIRVLKAKIRYGKLDQGDMLKISGTFDRRDLPQTFSPEGALVTVTLGPVSVISLPPFEDRSVLKAPKPQKLVYALKRTKEQPDSLKLCIDGAKGKFAVRAKRIDLSALKAAGLTDVTFALSVDGVVFAETIDLVDVNGQWRYRYISNGTVPGPDQWPGGGGGGGGGGGSNGGPVSFRTLNGGSFPGLTTFNTTVARTEAAYHAEWFKRYPPPPPGMGMPVYAPPTVDFATEIVVVIDLGTRPTGGYSVEVTRATEQGTGLRIDWVEKKPGANCVVTTALTHPFVIVAVSRRDGQVTFSGSVKTINCP